MVTDPNDVHVAALALAAGCETLITANISNFRAPALRAEGIAVVVPDAFLTELYQENPEDMITAIEAQVTGRMAYPTTLHDILSLLYRAGCSGFATTACADLVLPAPDPRRHQPGQP